MKKLMIIALLLVGALLIPAVSAEELYDSGDSAVNFNVGASSGITSATSYFKVYRIQDYPALTFLYVKADNIDATPLSANPSYQMPVTFYLYQTSTVLGHGTAYYNGLKNPAGTYVGVQCWVEIDEWNIGSLSGSQLVTVTPQSGTLFNGIKIKTSNSVEVSSTQPIGFYLSYNAKLSSGVHMARNSYEWKNSINITQDEVKLTRVIDGQSYHSTISIVSDLGSITDSSALNIDIPYLGEGTWTVTNSFGKVYTGSVGGGESKPSGSPVTVYIRNSQTGALISNAHLTIEASVNGNLHPVANKTVPSGVYQIDLQPTGGGMPNPDFYRLTVTAEGYTSLNPYMDFEVNGATTIYDYLYPVEGAPEDENKTFIDFYVRDLAANAVSGATVNFGGYTLNTNSAGYAIFEVVKNNTYSYKVTKTGYIPIEGIATVGNNDRYTVNVALMAGAVPTQTIVTPPITVTPTQTTPPIQEENLIGMSVKGLAKGFGIDYDTALLLFGLMIIFGAGGMVMSSVKGGAMEFIAGSIVGTFVAFALGLIPIWIFIIIAVVFGVYVLRVFVQGGQ